MFHVVLLATAPRKHPRVSNGGHSQSSRRGRLAAIRKEEERGTPVRGVAKREEPVRGVAKRSRSGTMGGVSQEDQGDGGVYSSSSPYSLPSTPSPPASPTPLTAAASPPRRESRDPVGHASLSSGHGRKRRRCSPETRDPMSVTEPTGLSETPRSRRRLLDTRPLESSSEGTGYVGEHGDLLSKADEALDRLRDNCYHSLDDFYSRNDHLDSEHSPPPGNLEYPNSDLLDPDLLNSDLSPTRSDRRSTARLGRRASHLHILSRAPAGPHVTVTGSEGDRVYLRLRDAGTGSKKTREGFRHHKGLLTVPFAELKAGVEEEVS